jgi:hypothetical protein
LEIGGWRWARGFFRGGLCISWWFSRLGWSVVGVVPSIACLTWARWTDGWAGWLGAEAVIWGDREGERSREREKVAGSRIGYVFV